MAFTLLFVLIALATSQTFFGILVPTNEIVTIQISGSNTSTGIATAYTKCNGQEYDQTPGDYNVLNVNKGQINRLMWWHLAGQWAIYQIDLKSNACVGTLPITTRDQLMIQSIFKGSMDYTWGCAPDMMFSRNNVSCFGWDSSGIQSQTKQFQPTYGPSTKYQFVGPCTVSNQGNFYCLYEDPNQQFQISVFGADGSSKLLPANFGFVPQIEVDSYRNLIIGFDSYSNPPSFTILDLSTNIAVPVRVPLPSNSKVSSSFVLFAERQRIGILIDTNGIASVFIGAYTSNSISWTQFQLGTPRNLASQVNFLTGFWN